MRLASLFAAFGIPQEMGNSATRARTGAEKTTVKVKEALPLLALADADQDRPPEYGAVKTTPKRSSTTETVLVTFDDVQMHLPPPPLDCFQASKYPELLDAVGPYASRTLQHCALSITCKTVKPWFRKPHKEVVSVDVVRDFDFEARQKALMEMEFETIRTLSKKCRMYAHTGDWYEKMLARYNNAVAEFERKYGDGCDALPLPPPPSVLPSSKTKTPPEDKRYVEIVGHRNHGTMSRGVGCAKGSTSIYFGFQSAWPFKEFKEVLVGEHGMYDDDARPIRFWHKPMLKYVVLTEEIYEDIIRHGTFRDIVLCN